VSAAIKEQKLRRTRIEEIFPELQQITKEAWREAVIEIWVEAWEESEWDDPTDCPKNANDVADYQGTAHVRSVTRQALAIADVVEHVYEVEVDRDVLITGSLLHDVSKLLESAPSNDGVPIVTRKGKLVQHGVLGAAKAIEKRLPDEVIHIIVGHTHQSSTVPATIEAIIVHYVDFLDSDILLLQRNMPLFAKR
jgi:putative nucleotidyltransferase with HDIG domain